MSRKLVLLAFGALAAGFYFFPQVVLYPLGAYLVDDSPPRKCDCLFVLAGDFRGQRVMHAAQLYREGLAPKLFVSGPAGVYGYTEDELAIGMARRRGATDVPFIGLPNNAVSTVSEARAVLPRIRTEGCRSVLVVTSNFHTRRAGRILRREWSGIGVHMAAAPTDDYELHRWWRDRQQQKTFFFEWSKTFADWLGL